MKEKLLKRFSGDLMVPPIEIDPWVSCATDLGTASDEIPLAASQGKILDENKLNNVFPSGQPNDFLVLDENLRVISRAGGAFVDLTSDQEVRGIKHFKDMLMADGAYIGAEQNNGIMLSYADGKGQISVWKDGQPDGEMSVVCPRFNDPYDETNDTPGSKDKKIREIGDEVKTKSQVIPSDMQVVGADPVKALSIDGTHYNIESGSKVLPSEFFRENAKKLRCLNVDGTDWNLPDTEVSESAVEGAKEAASLKVAGTDWNIPGTVARSAEGITPGPQSVVDSLVWSCQKLGKLVILHISFSIKTQHQGGEILLEGVPQPFETTFGVGDESCLVTVDHDRVFVTVPERTTTNRLKAYSIVYSVL